MTAIEEATNLIGFLDNQSYKKPEIDQLIQKVRRVTEEIILKDEASSLKRKIPDGKDHETHKIRKVDHPITYNLEDSIKKVQELSAKHKLCLFIGRTIDESLPDPKEGEVWVSMDLFIRKKDAERAFSKGFDIKPIDPKRVHLTLDFNNPDLLRPLHKLFDNIVVDQSTLKFFNVLGSTPWIVLGALLKETPESELTAEAFTGFFSYPHHIMGRENQIKYKEETLKETSATLDNSLRSSFNEVTFHRKESYPYSTAYNQQGETTDYFVVRHPKIDRRTLLVSEQYLRKHLSE